MISSIIDQVLHEGAISIIVAPALAVFLAQTGDIGGFVSSIIVVVVREVVGICVEGVVEPEAGKESERSYRQGEGKVAASGRALARRIRNCSTTGVATIVGGLEA
jgi:hypothetical protein